MYLYDEICRGKMRGESTGGLEYNGHVYNLYEKQQKIYQDVKHDRPR